MAATGMKIAVGDERNGKKLWSVTINGEKCYFENSEEALEAFRRGEFPAKKEADHAPSGQR